MSDILDKIEIGLEVIEKIEANQRLDQVQDLVDIGHWLEDGQAKSTPQELDRLDQLSKWYTRLAGPLADLLQTRVISQLDRYKKGQIPTDMGQLEKTLDHIKRDLALAASLSPKRVGQDEFQDLQKQLNVYRNKFDSKKRLQELRHEINKLWQRGDNIEQADSARAVDYYKQALGHSQAETGQGWELDEVDELILLRHEAEERYDDLRVRHEVPVTKQEGDELAGLVVQLRAWAEKNPAKSVTYWEDEYSDLQKSMSVEEAVEIATNRLSIFWKKKIQEYIEQAEKAIKTYQPREAMAALQKCELLPGLNDNRIGRGLSGNDKVLINRIEDKIKPELAALETAERFIDQAKAETDSIAAYNYWQDAHNTYVHMVDLKELKAKLINQAREEIKKLLDDTEQSLRSEQWNFCQTWLNRAKELLELDRGLKSEFGPRQNSLQQVYTDVEPLTWSGSKQWGGKKALDTLRSLKRGYKDVYWINWIGLQSRLAELEAWINVETIEQQARIICKPDGSLADLGSLYHDAKNMAENPPDELPPADKEKLGKVAAQLRAWHGFAQARDEMDKANQYKLSDGEDGWLDLPDLQLVKQGIEAAKQDRKTDNALRSSGLERKLKSFSSKDSQAKEALGKGQNLLKSHTSSRTDFKEALELAKQWLKEITNYRIELLELRQEAQQKLAASIEQEIHDMVAVTRQDYYINLNSVTLKNLLEDADRLLGDYLDSRRAAVLQSLTAIPLNIVDAYNAHQRAMDGDAQWDEVRQAWDNIAAQITDDENLRIYAVRQARQAHKKGQFLRVRLSPGRAETILRGLCDDPALQRDWEVWYEYGKHNLKTAQEHLRQLSSLSGQPARNHNNEALELLSSSRESLNRALALSPTNNNQLTEIDRELSTLEDWHRLAEAQRNLLVEFQVDNGRLTSAACRHIRQKFDEGLTLLKENDKQALLQASWRAQIRDVQGQLDDQIDQLENVAYQVDALIGKSILFPDDETIKLALKELIRGEFDEIKQHVRQVAFDGTAHEFRRRYEQEHSNALFIEADVAQLQLKETQQLIGMVQNLKTVQRTLVSQLGNLEYSLDEEEKNLQSWAGQLDNLLRTKNQVTQLARLGLQNPGHFEAAKRILLQKGDAGGSNTNLVAQIFRDQAHPTYTWCNVHLDEQQRRRKKIEELNDKVNWCLKFEHVVEPDQFPKNIVNSNEKQFVDELRRNLESTVSKHYPIEEVLRLMQAMRRQDPHDECGLQEDMSYSDPEDNQRLYESLTKIETIIQQKVDQLRTLRRWLDQLTDKTPSDDYLGVVNWPEQKVEIEKLRDSGLTGLTQAKELCSAVRDGDDQGNYAKLWSLSKKYTALSPDEMLGYLKKATGLSREVLFTISGSVDIERKKMQEELGLQIQECSKIQDDIQERLKTYNPHWSTFKDAYSSLMRKKKWRGSWVDTSEWANFQAAHKGFCNICPNDAEFVRMSDAAAKKTGISLSC